MGLGSHPGLGTGLGSDLVLDSSLDLLSSLGLDLYPAIGLGRGFGAGSSLSFVDDPDLWLGSSLGPGLVLNLPAQDGHGLTLVAAGQQSLHVVVEHCKCYLVEPRIASYFSFMWGWGGAKCLVRVQV